MCRHLTRRALRLQVCDYETNVARNLRIHMTSEKHMHNMMLLQQNMKQIQHSLHLGLAPAEAELYQYYLAQNMGLAGVKMESPAGNSGPDAQMMINPFQLDPATAAALGSGLGTYEYECRFPARQTYRELTFICLRYFSLLRFFSSSNTGCHLRVAFNPFQISIPDLLPGLSPPPPPRLPSF